MKKIFLTLLSFFILSANIAFADDMPLPINLQVVMFTKIFSYDKNMKSKAGDTIKIGVLVGSSAKSKSTKDSFLGALKAVGSKKFGEFSIAFEEIELSELGSLKSKGINVLYVTPDNKDKIASIKKASQSAQVLTITGVPEYVESGLAVGLELKGDSPKIIVNLSSAKAENADFSSNLLKLARIVN